MMVSKLTRLVAAPLNKTTTLTTRFIFTHENDKARSNKGENTLVYKASEQKKK